MSVPVSTCHSLNPCFIISSSHLACKHFHSYFIYTSLFLLEISAVHEGWGVTASSFRNFRARKWAWGELWQGQCCIHSICAQVGCLQVAAAAPTFPAQAGHYLPVHVYPHGPQPVGWRKITHSTSSSTAVSRTGFWPERECERLVANVLLDGEHADARYMVLIYQSTLCINFRKGSPRWKWNLLNES